jgi:hypothetical protein
MSEHKRDDLLATGAHKAWVGEPGRRDPGFPPTGFPATGMPATGSVVRAGAPRDPQRNWLDRSTPSNPRHAAITRSLNSWSNYKSWTDKVRNSWDKDGKK